MYPSICSDQISGDIATVLEVLQDCNCREFELRTLGFDPLLSADPRALDAVEKAVTLKRFHITQLTAPFFLQAGEAGVPTGDETKRFLELATRFKCRTISVFGGHPDDVDALVDDEEAAEAEDSPTLNALRGFIKNAQREKLQVLLRTHSDSAAGTAAEALALLKRLDCPGVKVDWDVVQCFAAGDDSGLNALDELLPHLGAVHLSDGVRRGLVGEPATLGKGVIPWEEIVDALHVGEYRGPIIVSHGLPGKLKESRHALTTLARWIDEARLRRRTKDDEGGAPKSPRHDRPTRAHKRFNP